MPPDSCHDQVCFNGTNPMSERNYPCDSIIAVYFGEQQDFNSTGAEVFKKQLWQCMLGQALFMKQSIEARRASNQFGIITWMFNEIWPTGGWGSIEYGNVGHTRGQILGGRAKPLLYFLRTVFADIMATCGSYSGPEDGYIASNNKSAESSITVCYVKNDSPREFSGTVTVTSIDFASGEETSIATVAVSMPSGAGQTKYFRIANVPNGTTAMLHAMVLDGAKAEVSSNYIPMTEPYRFAIAKSNVQYEVKDAANEDGSIDIVVTTDKVAVYVTLTTLAHGRFSDNVFFMKPGSKTVRFLPIAGYFVWSQFRSSLRVEHLGSYIATLN
eukprot:SAG31_NODE_732_length_12494_cov_3.395482_7_plen_328_part_00